MSELVRLRGKIYFTKYILCNGVNKSAVLRTLYSPPCTIAPSLQVCLAAHVHHQDAPVRQNCQMMKMWLSRCTTRTCAWRQWTSQWAELLGTRRTMLPSYFSITGCPSVHWWTQPCQWLIMFFTGSRDLRSSHNCPRGYRGICELLKSRTPHF